MSTPISFRCVLQSQAKCYALNNKDVTHIKNKSKVKEDNNDSVPDHTKCRNAEQEEDGDSHLLTR